MRMRKLAVVLLATTLSCGSAVSSFAASWIATGGNNWKYQNDNGSYASNAWVKHTDNNWYYLGADTMMKKGWFQNAAGKWYFLNANGAMQTGLIMVNNNAYYMNESGDLFEGEKLIQGKIYRFTVNGTTNGKPYVANKFSSNGVAEAFNNTQSGDGDSSTPSRPPVPPTVTEKTDQVANTVTTEVKEKHKEAIKEVVVSKAISTGDKKAEVRVAVQLTPEAMKTPEAIADTRAAVSETMAAIVVDLEPNSPVTLDVPGVGPVTRDASSLSEKDVDRWVTPEKLAELQAQGNAPVSVSVVIDGVTVVYKMVIN
ncbi:MAG: hypothetical protein RSF83_01430 [Hungatella sp.]